MPEGPCAYFKNLYVAIKYSGVLVVQFNDIQFFVQVSFTDEALLQNISAFVGALLVAKPVGLKKSTSCITHILRWIYYIVPV